jgi:hypothetical protein
MRWPRGPGPLAGDLLARGLLERPYIRQTDDGRTTLTLVEQPFHPHREVTDRWSGARP